MAARDPIASRLYEYMTESRKFRKREGVIQWKALYCRLGNDVSEFAQF